MKLSRIAGVWILMEGSEEGFHLSLPMIKELARRWQLQDHEAVGRVFRWLSDDDIESWSSFQDDLIDVTSTIGTWYKEFYAEEEGEKDE